MTSLHIGSSTRVTPMEFAQEKPDLQPRTRRKNHGPPPKGVESGEDI